MKTVFFDVDTQLDFLAPAGALSVPGAGGIATALSALTRFARHAGIFIISTVDAHTEDDPEFKTWKPHCVIGTQGQNKYSQTLTAAPLLIRNTPDALTQDSADLHSAPQLIVEKQTIDIFASQHLRTVLSRTAAERFVVYGLATEYCVRSAALGLLKTGARVDLVVDAIQGIDREATKKTLAEFEAAGGKRISLQDALRGG